MDPKTRSIVAYITIIGWIIALVTNSPKDDLTSFHIRQMLGIMCLGFVSMIAGWFPLIGLLLGPLVFLAAFILWVIAFIGAVNGEQKEVPFIGDKFQEWFKGL